MEGSAVHIRITLSKTCFLWQCFPLFPGTPLEWLQNEFSLQNTNTIPLDLFDTDRDKYASLRVDELFGF